MRNKPLPGLCKSSPLHQHELRELTPEESKAFKHGKHGSAPNPAKTVSSIYKGAKKLYSKLTK